MCGAIYTRAEPLGKAGKREGHRLWGPAYYVDSKGHLAIDWSKRILPAIRMRIWDQNEIEKTYERSALGRKLSTWRFLEDSSMSLLSWCQPVVCVLDLRLWYLSALRCLPNARTRRTMTRPVGAGLHLQRVNQNSWTSQRREPARRLELELGSQGSRQTRPCSGKVIEAAYFSDGSPQRSSH